MFNIYRILFLTLLKDGMMEIIPDLTPVPVKKNPPAKFLVPHLFRKTCISITSYIDMTSRNVINVIKMNFLLDLTD